MKKSLLPPVDLGRILVALGFSALVHGLIAQVGLVQDESPGRNGHVAAVGMVARSRDQFQPVQQATAAVETEAGGRVEPVQPQNEAQQQTAPVIPPPAPTQPVDAVLQSNVEKDHIAKPVSAVEPVEKPEMVVADDVIEAAAPAALKSQEELPPVVDEAAASGAAVGESESVSAAVATDEFSAAGSAISGVAENAAREAFQQALPRYELNPLPEYPASARRRRQQGTVLLEVAVSPAGRVDECTLFESSGFRSLDRAALKAVRRWKFKPALSLGEPIASRVIVPVDFVLH